MKRLPVLIGLVVAVALGLPSSANAGWFSEVKKLTAADAQDNDLFGWSVAISGDTAIVGAERGDTRGLRRRRRLHLPA